MTKKDPSKLHHPTEKNKQLARKQLFQLLDLKNEPSEDEQASAENFTSVDGFFVQGEGWKLDSDDE
ncbi:hypothetical protein FZC66_11670 [Priestia megaterium]|nr:hypothetical protein FZC66_11670 [Priestia megaterium]